MPVCRRLLLASRFRCRPLSTSSAARWCTLVHAAAPGHSSPPLPRNACANRHRNRNRHTTTPRGPVEGRESRVETGDWRRTPAPGSRRPSVPSPQPNVGEALGCLSCTALCSTVAGKAQAQAQAPISNVSIPFQRPPSLESVYSAHHPQGHHTEYNSTHSLHTPYCPDRVSSIVHPRPAGSAGGPDWRPLPGPCLAESGIPPHHYRVPQYSPILPTPPVALLLNRSQSLLLAVTVDATLDGPALSPVVSVHRRFETLRRLRTRPRTPSNPTAGCITAAVPRDTERESVKFVLCVGCVVLRLYVRVRVSCGCVGRGAVSRAAVPAEQRGATHAAAEGPRQSVESSHRLRRSCLLLCVSKGVVCTSSRLVSSASPGPRPVNVSPHLSSCG